MPGELEPQRESQTSAPHSAPRAFPTTTASACAAARNRCSSGVATFAEGPGVIEIGCSADCTPEQILKALHDGLATDTNSPQES